MLGDLRRLRPRERPGREMSAVGSRERLAGLEDQRGFQVLRRLGAKVLDASAAVGAQAVEAQAVESRIDFGGEAGAQQRPLRRREFAFEHRLLHPLAEVEAGPRHATQSPPAGGGFGAPIIGDQHQHGAGPYFQKKAG
jgi:hypothetical protein